MDDDLPKEGELLDISKKATLVKKQDSLISSETPKAKPPIGVIIIGILLLIVFFFLTGVFGSSQSKEAVTSYRQSTQSTFTLMKSQFPYLLNVLCEGSDPTKEDCVNFVGTFRPDKENPNYLTSMGVNDKVEGVTSVEEALIKETVKGLVDLKRTLLKSRKPLIFTIDSITVPRVGEEIRVRIKCKEDSKEVIVCERER